MTRRKPLALASTPATPKEKTLLAFLISRWWIFSKMERTFFLFGFRPPSIQAGGGAKYNSDEAKQKLFLREEKDFALPRLFLFLGRFAAQEGAGGMRGGNLDAYNKLCYTKNKFHL